MRKLFLRLVPRRGVIGGTADGEWFKADDEEQETVQLKSPILARQSSTGIISAARTSQFGKQFQRDTPPLAFETVLP